jgi:hypothetical protein
MTHYTSSRNQRKSHGRQDLFTVKYYAVVYQNGGKMKQLVFLFSLNCLLTFSRYQLSSLLRKNI